MAEPFKNLLNAGTVKAAAAALQRHWRAFNSRRFERLALTGLDSLEMKARAMQIADALEACLPEDFDAAATLIEASLAAPLHEVPDVPEALDPPGASAVAAAPKDDGLSGWIVWPLGEYVARRGLAHPRRGLAALHGLTQRLTAEWAIRPFIEAHPKLAFDTLARWATDPSAHVRRLVSEGSRPRLPWGLQLKGLIRDPAPTLPLLLALQDDPSEYVRRSVANHLNDIAKDHPDLVVDWVVRHLQGASAERRVLLKHASRSLIKSGHPAMLEAWGLGKSLRGEVTLEVAPRRIVLGDSLRLDVSLRSDSARRQSLVIDYAVHHVKANGATSPKVFKGWVLELAPHEQRTLSKQHAVRPITTRRYHAGRHLVDLRVNGRVLASAAFDLALRPGETR